jgi:Tol biopolymer transport system component
MYNKKTMTVKNMLLCVLIFTTLTMSGCRSDILANPTPTLLDINLSVTPSPTRLVTPSIIAPTSTKITTEYVDVRQKLSTGLYVAYWVDYEYEIYLAPFMHINATIPILKDALPSGSDVSPDGNYFVYSDLDRGGILHEIATGLSKSFWNTKTTSTFFYDVKWANNGNKIVFVSSDVQYDESIFVKDLETGNITLLTPWRGTKSHPCWSPDDKKIAFISDQIKFNDEFSPRHSIYLLDTQCIGNVAHCKDTVISLRKAINGDIQSLSWSPSGNLTFVTTISGHYGIFSAHPDGSQLDSLFLSDESKPIGPLAWSPDGKYLAFTQVTPSTDISVPDNADVYVLNVETGDVVNFTDTPLKSEIINFWLKVK